MDPVSIDKGDRANDSAIRDDFLANLEFGHELGLALTLPALRHNREPKDCPHRNNQNQKSKDAAPLFLGSKFHDGGKRKYVHKSKTLGLRRLQCESPNYDL